MIIMFKLKKQKLKKKKKKKVKFPYDKKSANVVMWKEKECEYI